MAEPAKALILFSTYSGPATNWTAEGLCGRHLRVEPGELVTKSADEVGMHNHQARAGVIQCAAELPEVKAPVEHGDRLRSPEQELDCFGGFPVEDYHAILPLHPRRFQSANESRGTRIQLGEGRGGTVVDSGA